MAENNNPIHIITPDIKFTQVWLFFDTWSAKKPDANIKLKIITTATKDHFSSLKRPNHTIKSKAIEIAIFKTFAKTAIEFALAKTCWLIPTIKSLERDSNSAGADSFEIKTGIKTTNKEANKFKIAHKLIIKHPAFNMVYLLDNSLFSDLKSENTM